MVQNLLHQLGIKVDLFVQQSNSLNEGLNNSLWNVYNKMSYLEMCNRRIGAKKASIEYRKTQLKELGLQARQLKKLGAVVTTGEQIRIDIDVKYSEAQRLIRLKEEWEKNAPLREQRRLERKAAKFKDAMKQVLDDQKDFKVIGNVIGYIKK